MTGAHAKLARMREIVRGLDRVLVAFSGGVDSTFLLRVAHDELGDRATAVTAVSPSLAKAEQAEARKLAALIGARHLELDTNELARDGYRANAPDRCFFCKTELFEKLAPLAEREGVRAVLYGEIVDDASDHRPGAQAARQARARAPIAEAGLTKLEIRALSREMGLPTWNKQSMACLSSRIPYGQEVTADKLAQVERAEQTLRDLGLRTFRVRHHDTVARLEIDPADFPTVLEPVVRDMIVQNLRAAGYAFVALDMQGYRTGSMNGAGATTSPRAVSADHTGEAPHLESEV